MTWLFKLFGIKGGFYSDALMSDLRLIWVNTGYDIGYAAALRDVEKDKVKTLQVKKDTK